MQSIQLTEAQQDLIERTGVFFEQTGMPPTESRIMTLLIVCDELELTFDQLRATLMISKSATSNAINNLLMAQQITFRTKLGDRKRYFSSNIHNWEENMALEMQKMFKITNLLKEIHAQRTPETVKFNNQLGNFIAFMEYLHNELPRLFSQWHQQNNQI
jgi:DNA-binding transcriptional regulator GbsR (MarR family)